MNRQTAKNQINRILREATAGLHRDEYWKPVADAWKRLADAGWVVRLIKTEYRWEDGKPVEKFWQYEVYDGARLNSPIPGVLTAHGAGTVEDPLSAYDISAYVS